MRPNKFFELIVTAILVPLWLTLIMKLVEKYPWLFYTAIAITTLLVLIVLIRALHDLLKIIDACYTFHCRRMDALVNKTRKKLQKIITRTNDLSIRNHAFKKLQEICPPKTYSNILITLAENEKRPEVKEKLLIRAKQSGGEQ